MLVLRRQAGQSIVIGRHAEIVIKVLHEEKGIISIGIAAPKAIAVDREEVYRKRESERNPAIENNITEDQA